MDDPLRDERIRQIRGTWEERDTEDLVEIWQKNDRQAWNPEAFEAIRQILLERTGSVPEQERDEDEGDEAAPTPDTYYDPQRFMRIATYAKSLAWVVAVLFGLILVAVVSGIVQSMPAPSSQFLNLLIMAILFLLPVAYCGFFWVVLQGISEGIYILMDIEENTRRPIGQKSRTFKR